MVVTVSDEHRKLDNGPPADVSGKICVRRQAVLDRAGADAAGNGRPLVLTVVLDEAVLRRSARAAGPVGPVAPTGAADRDPDEIRRAQLAHLLAAGRRPHVEMGVARLEGRTLAGDVCSLIA